jgi:hypothetical protein
MKDLKDGHEREHHNKRVPLGNNQCYIGMRANAQYEEHERDALEMQTIIRLKEVFDTNPSGVAIVFGRADKRYLAHILEERGELICDEVEQRK